MREPTATTTELTGALLVAFRNGLCREAQGGVLAPLAWQGSLTHAVLLYEAGMVAPNAVPVLHGPMRAPMGRALTPAGAALAAHLRS